MKFDQYKFKQIVLYIINKINKKQLGNVKLNKILWFADLAKCDNTGYSITGEKYIRQNYAALMDDIFPFHGVQRRSAAQAVSGTPPCYAHSSLLQDDCNQ